MALPMLTQYLGQNLRRIRRSRELSQRQIAQLARVTQAYISLVEHGYRPRRLDRVEGLARALATTTEALLAPPSSRGEVKGTKKRR